MKGIARGVLIPLLIVLALQAAPAFAATYKLGSRGTEVAELQRVLTDLGYGELRSDGVFGKGTEEALKRFQADRNLTVDGAYGPGTQREIRQAAVQPRQEEYVVQQGDSLWTISRKYRTTVKALAEGNGITEGTVLKLGQKLFIPVDGIPATASRGMTIPDGQAPVMLPWETADAAIPVGSTFTVTDAKTGITFTAKRIGGEWHADSEPLTTADTEAFRSAYGGTWSWDRRAVVIEFNGMRLAASVNGMPHDTDSIPDNGFNGMFCIHFVGSRVHQSNRIDPAHQAMIRAAAGL